MKLLTNYIPKLSRAGSNESIFRFGLLIVQFYYFVLSRKLGLVSRSRIFPLKFYFNGTELTYYLEHPMDVQVLVEIFVYKEYEWNLGETQPKYIFDLGAHFGDTTLYYSALYPQASIIAVEADPDNYKRLLLHSEQNKNIIPVNVAVGPIDGNISFFKGVSGIGFSIERRSEKDVEITVPQQTIATLCNIHNVPQIDLIKFDIEGAEFALFESLDLCTVAKAYIGELHFDLSSGYAIDTLQETLLSDVSNYNEVKIPGSGRYLVRFKSNQLTL